MTFQLTVLYHRPDDADAFDAHYESTHAPLASKIPGLRSYSVQRPGNEADGSLPPERLVATLVWDDEAAFAAGMGSPEGQAAAGDIGNFASGGVTMLTGAVTTYV
ncbi:MAG: EthD family reductase [Nocardioidaceae bacterium]